MQHSQKDNLQAKMAAEKFIPSVDKVFLHNFSQLGLLAIVVLLLHIVTGYQSNRKSGKDCLKKKSRIPNLPGLPIVGAIPSIFLHRNDTCNLANRWMKDYGSCWQTSAFGKRFFCINDPELLKIILSSKEPGHLDKYPRLYEIMFIGFVNSALPSMSAKTWSFHRKSLAPVFSYANIKTHMSTFNKHANQLCEDIEKNNANYHTLVYDKMFDIVTEVATGVPVSYYLGSSGGIKFHQNTEILQEIMKKRLVFKPWISIPFIWRFHPDRKVEQENFKQVKAALLKIKQNHKPSVNSEYALDKMINDGWGDEEILGTLCALILGGQDTVSTAVNRFIWMMAIEQKQQLACQQEIDEVLKKSNSSGDITVDDVNELKYVERCIKETMRLFSASVATTRHIQTKLKLTDDVTLQPGDLVSYMPYVVHRNPKHYPDPEKFEPDRFLLENIKQRPFYAFLPFSAGPRNCIAWKLAIVELTVVCATVLQKFYLYTDDTRDNMKLHFRESLCPERVPNIVFRRRS